jgi:hypothetical protein
VDYVHRAEREARLARALARLSAGQRRRLFAIMGNPPKLENVSPEYWNGAFRELQSVMTPELESIFVDAAVQLVQATPAIGVDWGLVNRGAADWARRYGFDLVTGITDTTRRGVQDAVADYYEEGLNLGQLRERLGRWYGPMRADMIASTEVTRASVEGEREVVREIREQGIEMVEVWQTNNDEMVCPLCGPRHGKPKGDGWGDGDGPPAHPRCRCWVTHELRPTNG